MNPDNPFLKNEYGLDTPVPGSGIVSVLQSVVITLSILIVVYLFVLTPSEVNGPSMRETLEHRDFLLVNKLVQVFGGSNSPLKSVFGDYQRSDIITFQKTNADGSKEDLVKRIIGVAGDRVMIQGGKVYLNGAELNEPYLADGSYENPNPTFPGDTQKILYNKDKTYIRSDSWLKEGIEVTVPSNKYFVLGDNRNNSQDSRVTSIAFVDRSQINGKVVFRILPLDSEHFVK